MGDDSGASSWGWASGLRGGLCFCLSLMLAENLGRWPRQPGCLRASWAGTFLETSSFWGETTGIEAEEAPEGLGSEAWDVVAGALLAWLARY